jgi:MraZ protein
MLFTGTYECSIDSKNRLSIPANIRANMDPEVDGTRFYLVPGHRARVLNLYADKYFERNAGQMPLAIAPGQERADFRDVFFGLATLLDVDKQGRVVLPQRLLNFAHIGKQVTLSGSMDRLVLWNREPCDEFMVDNFHLCRLLYNKADQAPGDNAVDHKAGNNGSLEGS